jgi:hypothetical protein
VSPVTNMVTATPPNDSEIPSVMCVALPCSENMTEARSDVVDADHKSSSGAVTSITRPGESAA